MRRERVRLFVGRLDQPVADAAVLGAFADRVDPGLAGLQMIVDHDPAIDREIGGAREVDVGADAGCDHHQRGLDLPPVLEGDGLGAAVAEDAGGLGVEMDGDAARFDRAQEHGRGARIELALHQPVHQVNDGNLQTGLRQAVSGLQAEQSAADHHRFGKLGRRGFDGRDIAQVAERAYSAQVDAGYVEPDRARAGGEHQPGERQRRSIGQPKAVDGRIDRGGGASVEQRHPTVAPPSRRLQLDFAARDLLRQH